MFFTNQEEMNMTEDFESDTRFADSVDNYTVNNLKHREKSRSGSQVTALLIRSLIIAFCIGLMGYSGFQIISKTVEDKKAEEVYEDLRVDEDYYISVLHATDLKEPNAMPTVLEMLGAEGEYEDYMPSDIIAPDKAQHYSTYYRNYIEKSAQYKNMYGWIFMTDTNINYPLMKGKDNEYYLKHNYMGSSTRSGSIFADCSLSDNYYANRNMVVYGHNMRDGSMFNTLKAWCNDASIKTLAQTSQIEIYTHEGVYIYDIFSFYVDDSNAFARTVFTDEADYLDFLKRIARRSNIKTNREYNAETRICTLITCTNGSNKDSRYVVHGILNQFIPFDPES